MNSKEQIMIDGVNVNKCIDFNKRDKVSCYHILYDKCDESPNCYFKQLARKTQECEELKKQLKTSEKWRIKAESLNEKLDIKNTRYREALEEIEKIVSKNYYDDTWADISIKLDDILNIINNAKGEGKCQ